MSTLLKFILMAVAWIVLYLASFHGCIKPEYCPADEATAVTETVAPPPAINDYAVVSSLAANEVLTGSLWAAERDALVARFKADPTQLLEVTGNYYDTEAKPADYENMGLLRAAAIKDILLRETDIPAENITTVGRLISGAPADDLWDAGDFRLKAAPTEETAEAAEVIQLDKDNIIILFPYNESRKDVDKTVDDYLVKLAQRLQQTNERVTLTGHTDDKGRPDYNMGLGQRRADFVKGILTRNGAPADRITTSSKGESTPRVPNTTPANRHQNRRVEVQLNAQ